MDNNKIALFLFPVILIAGIFLWRESMKTEPVPEILGPEFSIPNNEPNEPALNPAGYSIECSRIYRPVCGQIGSGSLQTFPNACSARFKGASILSEEACEESTNQDSTTATRRYVSQETEICETQKFTCEANETSFFDEQGCGCQNILSLNAEGSEIPETILFEGCPNILYELLCPEGYSKFQEANECGCKK